MSIKNITYKIKNCGNCPYLYIIFKNIDTKQYITTETIVCCATIEKGYLKVINQYNPQVVDNDFEIKIPDWCPLNL
jgi:hypothetical protein